jgi:mannose-6-phosphate isomerase-like protein (cupin superfamily)
MQEGLKVQKTWGTEQYVTNTELYCCKLLTVEKMKVCSRHRHLKKTETFYVFTGSGYIEIGDQLIKVKPKDVVHIPTGVWHRFWTEDCMVLLEVSTHHDDADVERQTESGSVKTIDGKGPIDTGPVAQTPLVGVATSVKPPPVLPSRTQPWFNSFYPEE